MVRELNVGHSNSELIYIHTLVEFLECSLTTRCCSCSHSRENQVQIITGKRDCVPPLFRGGATNIQRELATFESSRC